MKNYVVIGLGRFGSAIARQLCSLGAEVLLAARGGGRVKYDWVGMVLCCLIVCAALVLFAAAWCLVHDPDAIHF